MEEKSCDNSGQLDKMKWSNKRMENSESHNSSSPRMTSVYHDIVERAFEFVRMKVDMEVMDKCMNFDLLIWSEIITWTMWLALSSSPYAGLWWVGTMVLLGHSYQDSCFFFFLFFFFFFPLWLKFIGCLWSRLRRFLSSFLRFLFQLPFYPLFSVGLEWYFMLVIKTANNNIPFWLNLGRLCEWLRCDSSKRLWI